MAPFLSISPVPFIEPQQSTPTTFIYTHSSITLSHKLVIHSLLHLITMASFLSSPFSWLLLLVFVAISSIVPQTEARAFFVFGDSLVDNGNNNYLITSARADAPPYGIDYPGHRPTGRFSNGLNIPDLISTSRLSIGAISFSNLICVIV